MVLSYSRRIFVRFFLNSRTGPFLQGHVQAFEQWQSVPRVILYDNLKSAVLARQGQAIEFNPALLELAAHYRFEPRPVALARGNEKGRIERAIRYLRDNFFAARRWRDLEDLNEQALRWSLGPAMERACAQDSARSVREVFDQERPSLMVLPEHPFNATETLAVSVGKTPFIRFDLNDYSVPPEFVRSNLTVIADERQVWIVDQGKVIAEHLRHYGKREQIIERAHLDALRQHKRQAKGHSAQHRLIAVCAQTQTLLNQSVERGHRLATTLRLLLAALNGTESMMGYTSQRYPPRQCGYRDPAVRTRAQTTATAAEYHHRQSQSACPAEGTLAAALQTIDPDPRNGGDGR
jgi:hypothetical protein